MNAKKYSYKGKTYTEVNVADVEGEDACTKCAFHDVESGMCQNGGAPCIPEMRPDILNVYYVEVQDAQ